MKSYKGGRLYKVLGLEGRSKSGGSLKWHLPKDGKPGKWHSVRGKIVCCVRGLHLTNQPRHWIDYLWNRVFLAEGAGKWDADNDDKIAFARARLLKELTPSQIRRLR